MRIISVCLIFFLLVFLSLPRSIYSQEIEEVTGGQIDGALLETVPLRYLPDHPLYFLITFKESVSRFFKPSAAQRAGFDFIVAGKRLKESYLLTQNNQNRGAMDNLKRYEGRLAEMTKQIEKARSQNQDIAHQVGVISDGFKNHEIFLMFFLRENQRGKKIESAIQAFKSAVVAIDKLNPGIINRFKILKTDEDKGVEVEPLPLPTDNLIFNEASPSVRPRQIIL